jgi:hypothetical protein
MLDESKRHLIWVPIIHTQADLGSLSGSVRRLYVRKIGQAKWDQHIQAVHEIWAAIRETLSGLALDYDRVRLYQDGLPTCGHEVEIVRDLVRAGSENHQLLMDLFGQGAKLVGTESPGLLLEEYELARQVVVALETGQASGLAQRQRELGKLLLDKRDSYIAARIDETLGQGEIGLLFLGLLHSLDGRLAADIRVTRLGSAQRVAPSGRRAGPAKQRSKAHGED